MNAKPWYEVRDVFVGVAKAIEDGLGVVARMVEASEPAETDAKPRDDEGTRCDTKPEYVEDDVSAGRCTGVSGGHWCARCPKPDGDTAEPDVDPNDDHLMCTHAKRSDENAKCTETTRHALEVLGYAKHRPEPSTGPRGPRGAPATPDLPRTTASRPLDILRAHLDAWGPENDNRVILYGRNPETPHLTLDDLRAVLTATTDPEPAWLADYIAARVGEAVAAGHDEEVLTGDTADAGTIDAGTITNPTALCKRCEGDGIVWDESACGDPEHCAPWFLCNCDEAEAEAYKDAKKREADQ